MQASPAIVELESLGVLRIRGPDATSFLQGQLSNDLERLAVEGALLAGYHNPQGRALALLRLLATADGDLLAILPRELIAPVRARLTRYILRAKVEVRDDCASWRVQGVIADTAPGSLALPLSSAPARWLTLAPATAAAAPSAHDAWKRLDIAAGVPQVYLATSEQFLAQMLNLDLLGGVSFAKGCYTGQEVIARAHYRGRVKRRMQRFRTLEPGPLAPGDSGHFDDGRAFRVVDVAPLPDGRSEFLAVAALASTEPHSSEPDTVPEAERTQPTLAAEPLALPYALPS